MYLEGSLRQAVGLSWVVLAQSPTHSCSRNVAGPGVISQLLLPGPWVGLVEHLSLHAASPEDLFAPHPTAWQSHSSRTFLHGHAGLQV